MESISKFPKLREAADQPQHSNAYIRSLVKQLASSHTKDPISATNDTGGDAGGSNVNGIGTKAATTTDQQGSNRLHQPAPHKRQVRRRLHTIRPYQERLLNMAEARREIMTALKFHRAAMKQANGQMQQVQHKSSDERNHCPNNYHQPPNSNNPYSPWPTVEPSTMGPLDNNGLESTTDVSLGFGLPNQTLGLNLNFQAFNNHLQDLNNSEMTRYCPENQSNFLAISSPSSSSSSLVFSSPTDQTATDDQMKHFRNAVGVAQNNTCCPAVAAAAGGGGRGVLSSSFPAGGTHVSSSEYCTSGAGNGGLHLVLDDDEMAEIRSIGEQHQIEWSDTVNLVTSAWWFKFLHNMEVDHAANSFDQATMEDPCWMNTISASNESSTGFLHHHLISSCYASGDYQQDPDLPCMDIGEIDSLGEGWLA